MRGTPGEAACPSSWGVCWLCAEQVTLNYSTTPLSGELESMLILIIGIGQENQFVALVMAWDFCSSLGAQEAKRETAILF